MREAFLDDLLCHGLMLGIETLDKRYSLAENGDISLENAFHHLCDGIDSSPEAPSIKVRIFYMFISR